VKHPATQVDAGVLATHALDEGSSELVALGLVDLPAENHATPHVLDDVQVVELPSHEAAKVRDVPRAHLPPETIRHHVGSFRRIVGKARGQYQLPPIDWI
jgi:hypothetical protein